MHTLIEWFQKNFPQLVEHMHNTTHHYDEQNLNPYHLEGDIWTHTMLVCNKAKNLNASNNVKLCALLHDIGKPESCIVNEKKLKKLFTYHENISTFLAIDVLNKLEEDFPEFSFNKTEVLLLINWHSDLHTIGTIDESGEFTISKDEYEFLSKKYGHKPSFFNDMIDMNTCDNNGRFYSNKDVQNIETKFQTLKDTRLKQSTYEYDDSKPDVVVLTGIPCSGKSTFIQKLLKEKDYVIISSDNAIMERYPDLSYNDAFKKVMDNDEFSEIEKEILKKFQDTVRNNKNSKNKQSIIIDRTNMSKKSRRKWLNSLDKDYNCKVEVFLMGEKIFKERNSSRNNSEGKHIGFKTIQEMVKHFTVPGMDEAHIVNYKVLSEKKDRKNIEFEKHKPIPYLKDKLKPAKPKTKDLEF